MAGQDSDQGIDLWYNPLFLHVLVITLSIFLFLLFLWFVGPDSKYWYCLRLSNRGGGYAYIRQDLERGHGIELADRSKAAKQKLENDKTRKRATGTGYPNNGQYSMAAAGLGAGHPNPPPDDFVFDDEDLRENEEVHPHEVKKTAPTPPKSRIPTRKPRQETAEEFEDINLNSGDTVKPKEMV